MEYTQPETPKRKNDETAPSSTVYYGVRVGVALLVIAVLAGIVGIVRAVMNANDGQLSASELAVSLKPVSQLATLKVRAAKVNLAAEIKTGLCSFSAKYFINSEIEAGIDLSTFSDANITYDEAAARYRITVPHPQLTNCNHPQEPPRRYDQTTSAACGGINFEEDLDKIARYIGQTSIRDDVLQGGILERTKNETRILMQQLVKTLTGKTAEIVFAEAPTEPPLPPSCNPDTPPRWQQNAAGVWEKL